MKSRANKKSRRRKSRRSDSKFQMSSFQVLENRRMLATFTVTNLNDSGAGSLRDAITTANNVAGADTITFSPLFVTDQTITLASQLPTISDDLTITGSGANLLTIDAGNGADGECEATEVDLDLVAVFAIVNVEDAEAILREELTVGAVACVNGQ